MQDRICPPCPVQHDMTAADPQPVVAKRKRGWYQYSLGTLLCVSVVLAVIFSWPCIHGRYIVWRLQEYDDGDLTKLPDEEQQRIGRWVAYLLGKPYESLDTPSKTSLNDVPENWLLHVSTASGLAQRMYVIQMEPTINYVGFSFCQIHTLDYWGRLVGSIRFKIGYRALLPNAPTLDESQHGFLCLTVNTHHTPHVGETRQLYYITDKYPELLRIERIDGRFAMGNGNLFDLQDKPPDWSDWKRLLESSDRLQQLRGLAAFWSYDNLQHLGPIEEKTRLRLEHLSKSSEPWISEESTWALRFIADRRAVPGVLNRGEVKRGQRSKAFRTI